jgi:hypothetical protein
MAGANRLINQPTGGNMQTIETWRTSNIGEDFGFCAVIIISGIQTVAQTDLASRTTWAATSRSARETAWQRVEWQTNETGRVIALY